VLEAVPRNKTVAGVPARVVGDAGCAEPARSMDQILAEKRALAAGDGGG
jgi:serine O-acetyltransferase